MKRYLLRVNKPDRQLWKTATVKWQNKAWNWALRRKCSTAYIWFRQHFTCCKCSHLTFSCWSSCCAIFGLFLPFVSVLPLDTFCSDGWRKCRVMIWESVAIDNDKSLSVKVFLSVHIASETWENFSTINWVQVFSDEKSEGTTLWFRKYFKEINDFFFDGNMYLRNLHGYWYFFFGFCVAYSFNFIRAKRERKVSHYSQKPFAHFHTFALKIFTCILRKLSTLRKWVVICLKLNS